MNSKAILFFITLAVAIIILEPWLILVFEPSAIYLFNVIASIVFITTIVFLIKKIKKEKAKKEIISLAAHQLSSPLASIKWSLEMLLNNDFGKISEEQKEIIRDICKKNEQLIYLVEDLLNTARIEEGKYLLRKELCNIEDIVLSAISFYQDEIEKKKINFKFNKPEKKLPEISIDKHKMKLAIQNLFDNAIKYTHAGGEIIVSLKNRGKYIEFKIQDSGIGIAKKQKQEIFNKFFRGNNAIKKEPMGYGLGLFFVKSIINSHNGKVWFKSKENEGSAFYFTIPIRK